MRAGGALKQEEKVMDRCCHCKQEIARPIAVSIRAEKIEPENLSFCCWECAAIWFNRRAGEILMPDLDAPFFDGRMGQMRKW